MFLSQTLKSCNKCLFKNNIFLRNNKILFFSVKIKENENYLNIKNIYKTDKNMNETGCCCEGSDMCWKCNKPVKKCSFFCANEHCLSVQFLNSKDNCNYFELLNV